MYGGGIYNSIHYSEDRGIKSANRLTVKMETGSSDTWVPSPPKYKTSHPRDNLHYITEWQLLS
jgi:hypothetical protein